MINYRKINEGVLLMEHVLARGIEFGRVVVYVFDFNEDFNWTLWVCRPGISWIHCDNVEARLLADVLWWEDADAAICTNLTALHDKITVIWKGIIYCFLRLEAGAKLWGGGGEARGRPLSKS